MSNASIILVPSIGAIRPFSDFAGASLRLSARIVFTAVIPEGPNQPYGIKTELVIASHAEVKFLEADTAAPPEAPAMVEKASELFSNSASFVLGTSQVHNPVVLPQVPAANDLGFGDDLLSESVPQPPSAAPSLSFGDSPIFNAMVLAPMSDQHKQRMINSVQTLGRYFAAMDELTKLRKGPTVIGEGGDASPPNQDRAVELERMIEASAPQMEAYRKNLADFLSRRWLVLTDTGFLPTQTRYKVPKPTEKNPKNVEIVEEILATPMTPGDLTTRITNFVEDHVRTSNAVPLLADVSKFVKAEFDALSKAVRV